MATGDRNDPYRSFNFQLEIDNIPTGAFSECSGLTAEGDAVDYREGTDLQPNVRKLVGLRKFSNIVLKLTLFSRTYFQRSTCSTASSKPMPVPFSLSNAAAASSILPAGRFVEAVPKFTNRILC